MIGVLAAALVALQGIALIGLMCSELLYDEVQHRRREAGEGFYDAWPEELLWKNL